MPIKKLLNARLVAIVRQDDLSNSEQLALTLLEAGVTAIEFTLTNADAPNAIRKLRKKEAFASTGSALIGLGSVRTLDEAKLAVESGAQFVVSPITSITIIEYCKQNGIGVCPGAFTPTEIAMAWEAGADIVKVFPARSLGPNFIRDVLAPMPYLKLMPTGGIDLNNIQSYFQAGALAVGIGSQLLDPIAIRDHDWARIRTLAQSYVTACGQRGTKSSE
jgi:2-dehydro-3-deoxyphosphogluconate aldolase / (4S)-4-hydroxy-2-oxoglutarate aldolase